MVNDLTTLNGSLQEIIDRLESNLEAKGVSTTFDSSTGILGLVDNVLDIPASVGGITPTNNITFTKSPSNVYEGDDVLLSAKVNAIYDDTSSTDTDWIGYLTGATVTFKKGGSVLGTAVTGVDGIATYTLHDAQVGGYSILASYDSAGTDYNSCHAVLNFDVSHNYTLNFSDDTYLTTIKGLDKTYFNQINLFDMEYDDTIYDCGFFDNSFAIEDDNISSGAPLGLLIVPQEYFYRETITFILELNNPDGALFYIGDQGEYGVIDSQTKYVKIESNIVTGESIITGYTDNTFLTETYHAIDTGFATYEETSGGISLHLYYDYYQPHQFIVYNERDDTSRSAFLQIQLLENNIPASNKQVTITTGFNETVVTDDNGLATFPVTIDENRIFSATIENTTAECNVKYVPYTPIKYLQSTGSQYINTEQILKSDDVVEVKVSSQGQNTYEAVFGARKTNADYKAFGLFNRFARKNEFTYFRTGNEKEGDAIALDNPYTVIMDKQNCTIYSDNGEIIDTITSDGSIEDCINPCGLFCINTNNSTGFTKDTYGYMKIYYFKITGADGTVKKELVPVITDDGEGNMYDLVNGTLCSKTGTFDYGRIENVNNYITKTYDDDCSIDKAKNYDVVFHHKNKNIQPSLTHESNHYIFDKVSGDDAWSGFVIPSITGSDNVKIQARVKLTSNSAYCQFGLGFSDNLYVDNNGDFSFFRIRGDNKMDILDAGGNEDTADSNINVYDRNIIIEIIKQGNEVTFNVYFKNTDNLLKTYNYKTIKDYSHPYFFFARNMRDDNTSTIIYSIHAESI